MKIKFTKDLRGRILNQDIVLTNITLEEAIQRLKNLGYDITKLSAYAKRVCDSYKLNRILGKLRDVDEEKSKILIRENILNLYGDDIGDNCLNVYLVAYCVNKYPELSVISAVKKFFEEEEIRKAIRENPNKNIANNLKHMLPLNFIKEILDYLNLSETKPNELTKENENKIVEYIKDMKLTTNSTLGIQVSMVTSGGVSVKEINSSTMESKLIENLYFTGEVIDVDAETGGYNLQIAFSTGYLAGISI